MVGGPVHVTLDSIAPNVWVVRNGTALMGNFFFNPLFFYTSLAVRSDSFLTVIETPVGNGVSRSVIAELHARMPGIPIRFVCPTHYHSDHAGGVAAFVDSGATVITTPGNRGAMAGRIARGAGGKDSVMALSHVQTFTDRRELGDAAHRVVLFEVPNPHVDEMVVAWIPAAKVLFVSDLFEIVAAHAQDRLSPANPSARALAKAIAERGLDVRILVSGHGRVASGDELTRMLSSRAK
jgi:glyoxylase-like metal-dependent hydrolase (beta-lactamase superfamily II)